MEPILKIENLKTSFMTSNGEVQAVRGVSFSSISAGVRRKLFSAFVSIITGAPPAMLASGP